MANEFNVGVSTIHKWINMYNNTKSFREADQLTEEQKEIIKLKKELKQKEVVKQDIKNLVGLLGKFTPKNDAEIFAKYLIIHTEIISIHPFEDGNGRISRLLAETYLEQNGYHPYTPFSDGAKREYQDAMGVFSVKSQNSLVEAYEYLTEFILNEYLDNIKNFKMSLEKFESVQKNEIINNK